MTNELQICRAYAVRIHDATVRAGGATVLDPDVTARIVAEARRDAVTQLEQLVRDYKNDMLKIKDAEIPFSALNSFCALMRAIPEPPPKDEARHD